MEDNRQTTAWLPPDLYEWLRQAAFERRVSQSQIIRELIEAERDRAGAVMVSAEWYALAVDALDMITDRANRPGEPVPPR